MAAIAFNAAHQANQVGERLKTVLMLLRRLRDAVSYRMRLPSSEPPNKGFYHDHADAQSRSV
jgi:hypothetical protein